MSTSSTEKSTPNMRVSRPVIPGYNVPEGAKDVLPWEHVGQRLADEENYWVGTAASDGRPHAVPVWAVWLDERLYFLVGPRSVRNLTANPAVVVHLESGTDVVIVEGNVEKIINPAPELSQRVVDAFVAKYDFRPESIDGWMSLKPSTVYAWTNFPADATRWRFA